MSASLSPYALLTACKPKSAPTVTTAYDYYSALQSCPSPDTYDTSDTLQTHEAAREPEPPAQPGLSAYAMPLVPRGRTHYIEQIRSRHSAAVRRAFPPASP